VSEASAGGSAQPPADDTCQGVAISHHAAGSHPPPPHGRCRHGGQPSWLDDDEGPAHPCCRISQKFAAHERCPCLQGGGKR
jgi:hypothetical protein